ncbi:endonuclease I [Flavobacterium faecale]|uniref:Endonuclease I n=1 Tax=Flavobacterium faecale TaxID=1355330 RepID=A0A2S1LDK9_9FLAO|nr:endonuclease [Flavobacterium faecale]AWG21845.1 endonuclease I [Flavobacterium faecale]
MKLKLLLLLVLLGVLGHAQIPANYYISSNGTGYALKTQLYNIIKNHTVKSYDELYTTYQTSDRDYFYENDGTVLDMYSEKPSAKDPYNYSSGSTQRCGSYSSEGNCYNREHIIPQSSFNSSSPMVSDAHFITPTDGKVNGQRSNYPHGNVATASWTSLNGSKLGTSAESGYTGTVFEPIDEFKGDIARMYFYFATRYETTVSGYSYPMFNGTSNQVFTTTFLNMLLAWNALDPVSPREIARNNAIYAIQNNRNPYIDHPEYVQKVWNPTTDTTAPSAPTNLAAANTTQTNTNLSWTAATDNIAVTTYEVYQGTILKATVTNTNYAVTGLSAATTYNFIVKAKDAAGNTSSSSNTLLVTTSSNTSNTATDLYFSEYVEGSANNKALEISNATTSTVNLSIYSIKKQTNGSGSWSTGIPLSGNLSKGNKYIIVNSSITTNCYSTAAANISTTAAEMTFNGNDAVGLFKNGILIDIIGTFNGGTSNFAADVTLRRKASITSPNTQFNKTGEWDTFSSDTCNNLGSKTVQAITKSAISKDEADADEVLIYPNPSQGNFTVYNSNMPFSVTIYNILGQFIQQENSSNSSTIQLTNIPTGTYLIKVSDETHTTIKKILIN